jgi:L-threonylcarbamoyladenylate synthase
MSRIIPASPETITQAAAMLRNGECVAFPTETVYGLGADATQDQAVAKIYAIKNRPQINPLIIHVASPAQLDALIVWNDQARELAQRFWPGPLTLVLPVTAACPISLLARAGLSTLAVRIPAHKTAQALLRAAALPIAAPSANRSGSLSPTTPLHVAASLGDAAPLILADGATAIGIESTILDLTEDTPRLLRAGGIALEQLELCLSGQKILAADENAGIKAPGQLTAHYAPRLPLRLNVTTADSEEGFLLFGRELGLRGGKTRLNLSEEGDLHEAAANLFAMLHRLDAEAISGIAVSAIPETGLGLAINDRLRRAAFR